MAMSSLCTSTVHVSAWGVRVQNVALSLYTPPPYLLTRTHIYRHSIRSTPVFQTSSFYVSMTQLVSPSPFAALHDTCVNLFV